MWLMIGFAVGAMAGGGFVEAIASRALANVSRTATEERQRLHVQIERLRNPESMVCKTVVDTVVCIKAFNCPQAGGQCVPDAVLNPMADSSPVYVPPVESAVQ